MVYRVDKIRDDTIAYTCASQLVSPPFPTTARFVTSEDRFGHRRRENPVMLASRARSTVLRSLRGSVCALSHARHSSSAPVTSGATSVYPDAPSPLQVPTDRPGRLLAGVGCGRWGGCSGCRMSILGARTCELLTR